MQADDEMLSKCGGCGARSPLEVVRDKKQNRGYLCAPCRRRFAPLLAPDSIRNFWMRGACGYRVLAGTEIDARVDEIGGCCPHCNANLNFGLVNLSGDRPILSGVIGEPLE